MNQKQLKGHKFQQHVPCFTTDFMRQEMATSTGLTLGTMAPSAANTQDCKDATKIKELRQNKPYPKLTEIPIIWHRSGEQPENQRQD